MESVTQTGFYLLKGTPGEEYAVEAVSWQAGGISSVRQRRIGLRTAEPDF
jgi:hypothetical protein